MSEPIGFSPEDEAFLDGLSEWADPIGEKEIADYKKEIFSDSDLKIFYSVLESASDFGLVPEGEEERIDDFTKPTDIGRLIEQDKKTEVTSNLIFYENLQCVVTEAVDAERDREGSEETDDFADEQSIIDEVKTAIVTLRHDGSDENLLKWVNFLVNVTGVEKRSMQNIGIVRYQEIVNEMMIEGSQERERRRDDMRMSVDTALRMLIVSDSENIKTIADLCCGYVEEWKGLDDASKLKAAQTVEAVTSGKISSSQAKSLLDQCYEMNRRHPSD